MDSTDKAHQIIAAFLDLYRQRRDWISGSDIVTHTPRRDISVDDIHLVMSMLEAFDMVQTRYVGQPEYALHTQDRLRQSVTLGSLLGQFEKSLVA